MSICRNVLYAHIMTDGYVNAIQTNTRLLDVEPTVVIVILLHCMLWQIVCRNLRIEIYTSNERSKISKHIESSFNKVIHNQFHTSKFPDPK